MIRLLFTMLMWVTVARWVYAEAEISAPFIIPVIDSVLDIVQIPTHDNWPDEPLQAAMTEARVFLDNPEAIYSSIEQRLSHQRLSNYGFDRF